LDVGNLPAALTMLLSARQSENGEEPEYEVRMVRKLLVVAVRSTHPNFSRLCTLMDDIRLFGSSRRMPKGDIPEMEGDLLFERGDWTGALDAYERAWRDYDDSGYVKFSKAYRAALCCLRIGSLAACEDWLSAMSDCDQEWAGNGVYQAELALRMAIVQGSPANQLIGRLRVFIDRGSAVQGAETSDDLREFTARVYLLDPAAGDPAARQHLARQELRRRCTERYVVSRRYAARLVFLDYRIACLRHAAGITPVDDLYHTHPEYVPAPGWPLDVTTFARRLAKARSAARWALLHAERLDRMLQCDWRQIDVRDRMTRIEAIAKATGTGLTKALSTGIADPKDATY
jgi:hypothetical protein